MRVRRTLVMVTLGAGLTGSLALGVAAPAGAAVTNDYRAYQQTLPASVIDGLDLDEDQKTSVVNNTRTGVVGDRNVVPMGTGSLGPRALFPALSTVMFISDQIQEGNAEEFDRNGERPSWIPEDEWTACATTAADDWTGSLFDGLRDWTASLNGVDCNEVRAGWDRERNPDYVPQGTAQSAGGFPVAFSGCGYGTPSCSSFAADVFWSTTIRTIGGVTRQEGWVLKVNRTAGTENTYIVSMKAVSPSGALGSQYLYYGGMSNPQTGNNFSQNAQCSTATQCVLLSASNMTMGAWTADSSVTVTKLQAGSEALSAAPATPSQLPYINPTTGSYSAELARQVVLTAVRTESGGVYQCRTESFVETAPTIPRPCEPDVPPGEVITERTTEVVPETDTGYVPGSNPTRGIQTVTVPDVVRDWQRENDESTLLLLDLELEGVGSCFDHPEECADWYNDPQKTTRYTCTYGGVVVDLAQCYYYARLFKSLAIAQGTAYPQPGQPDPTGTPGGSTSPGTGIRPGESVGDPTQTRNCWAGIVSWNPLDWVFTPVKCALEWAFVPRSGVVKDQMEGLQARAALKGPVVLATAITAWSFDISPAGCSGLNVAVSTVWPAVNDFQILNACGGEPLAPIAALSSWVLGISAAIGATIATTRNIAGIVQYGGIGGTS